MDSPLLSAAGQAKSVRRPVPTFTWHSQLFHKHQNCARRKKEEELRENLRFSEIADARLPRNGARKPEENFGNLPNVFGRGEGIRRCQLGPRRSEGFLLRREWWLLRGARPWGCKFDIRSGGSLPCQSG